MIIDTEWIDLLNNGDRQCGVETFVAIRQVKSVTNQHLYIGDNANKSNLKYEKSFSAVLIFTDQWIVLFIYFSFIFFLYSRQLVHSAFLFLRENDATFVQSIKDPGWKKRENLKLPFIHWHRPCNNLHPFIFYCWRNQQQPCRLLTLKSKPGPDDLVMEYYV